MLILVQLVYYCLLYILLVKCAVRDDGRNCLYFYPKEYIEEAQKRGIADKETVMKKVKVVYDTILYYYICGSDFDYFCLESCYGF